MFANKSGTGRIMNHNPRNRSPIQKMVGEQNGNILGLVMVFFVVFSIMGLGFMRLSMFERIAGIKHYHDVQAFYHAEAGISKGLWLANHVSNAAATFSEATVSVVYDSVISS